MNCHYPFFVAFRHLFHPGVTVSNEEESDLHARADRGEYDETEESENSENRPQAPSWTPTLTDRLMLANERLRMIRERVGFASSSDMRQTAELYGGSDPEGMLNLLVEALEEG